jgi:hypothetical protein
MIHKQALGAEMRFDVPGRIIHVGLQAGNPFVWYEVGATRTYALVMTDQEQPRESQHVGSVVGIDGWFVAHIYGAALDGGGNE